MDRTRQYFTLVYGVMHVGSCQFRYVTAGHPSPVLLPRGGTPAAVAGAELPIGMFAAASFEEASLTLEPGDRLYFYTDGVIEALDRSEDDFGHGRLLDEIARRAISLCGRASTASRRQSGRTWCDGRMKDDASLLAVEREP